MPWREVFDIHGPEQLLVHVPYITAGEAILDTLRVSQTGERARPRPGRRLEVDDLTIQSEFFAVVPATFLKTPRRGTHASGEAFSAKARLMMKYRDIEYTVLQGIERGVWKWSASVKGVVIKGQAAIKSEAVTAAEKAIDRALAAKKVWLITPKEGN